MNKFQELLDDMKNNDSRGTASPYILLLEECRPYVANEQYASCTRTKYVENITGDFSTNENKEELINLIREYLGEDDWSPGYSDITKYEEGTCYKTVNVFLTDKGYEKHRRLNGHNLGEHRTYGIHAFRNPEITTLLEALEYAAENAPSDNTAKRGEEG